jgi:hypothetical protein
MNIQQLIVLRKVTRAVAEALRTQLKEYLFALSPLIRPKLFFGDFVTGTTRESPNFADKAFQELVAFYHTFALTKPFQCPQDLKSPLELVISPLEFTALEYVYEAKTDRESKRINVTSPLKWVLSFPDCDLSRLKEHLAEKHPPVEVVTRYCVHYAVMSYVLKRQTGFQKMLEALRFQVTSTQLPEFGLLPVTIISSPISTLRPPDSVLIENTEISGTSSFEEVVSIDDIINLPDPLYDQLTKIVEGIQPELLGD